MKLNDNCYNKLKLLYCLSKMLHFIEKHAETDAQQAGDTECQKVLSELKNMCGRYVEVLEKISCLKGK